MLRRGNITGVMETKAFEDIIEENLGNFHGINGFRARS